MKPLSQDLEKIFKKRPLYSQEKEKNPLVIAKLFDNSGSGTWHLMEYDPIEKIAFGLVTGLAEDELGYFSIQELETIRHPILNCLRIERDLSFKQQRLWDLFPHLSESSEK